MEYKMSSDPEESRQQSDVEEEDPVDIYAVSFSLLIVNGNDNGSVVSVSQTLWRPYTLSNLTTATNSGTGLTPPLPTVHDCDPEADRVRRRIKQYQSLTTH